MHVLQLGERLSPDAPKGQLLLPTEQDGDQDNLPIAVMGEGQPARTIARFAVMLHANLFICHVLAGQGRAVDTRQHGRPRDV